MTDASIPHKRCTKCGETKPLSEYYKCKREKDGLRFECKDCGKAYYVANRERASISAKQRYAANPEPAKERSRRWYAQNTEHALELARRWREQNAETVRKNSRQWAKRNPELRREISHRWKKANREQIRESGREYRQLNPHIYTAAKHRYRARKSALPDYFTTEHMVTCLEYFNHVCAVCGSQFVDLFGEISLHWDHWIPISSDDCPGTIPTNMLCLCNGCNLTKHAKMPDEWLRERFGAKKAKRILERIQCYFEAIGD